MGLAESRPEKLIKEVPWTSKSWLPSKKPLLSEMRDVELAKRLLEEEELSLVITKQGHIIYSSKEKGVRPLFQAILSLTDSLGNAAVADRVVGSPVAMLCLYAGISSVYALLASERALTMLRKQGVNITATDVVPSILNSDRTDLCPFEKLAQSCTQPSELVSALERLFESS